MKLKEMLLMKLSNLSKTIFLFLASLLFFTQLLSEESVNIWTKKNLNKKIDTLKKNDVSLNKKKESKIKISTRPTNKIEINLNNLEINKSLIHGLYDPSVNDLTLDMWANSEGTRVKDTIERINKIKLSSFAEEIFLDTLLTISNLPDRNMTNEEFTDYKIDWLIANKKDELIILFLNKNKNFTNKNKILKYLIDKNIAKTKIKNACEQTSFINNSLKNFYLEQFKVICLINKNKKNEAQLLLDLLREQKLSNKFFDNKINYLLGVSSTVDQKIDDTSLLNFYLSSITVSDFNYTPDDKTNIKIWEYLSSANLINIDNFNDKNQIKELEIVANKNNLSKSYILEIYKSIKFNFNDFLNIDQIYKTLDPVTARALVYQKTLLSDNVETELKYLFLLKDLFKKDNLTNVFKEYLSQKLKILDVAKIPPEYEKIVAENIIYEKENRLGKIKYNDKSYHSSKVTRYYVEKKITKKNTEKELLKIHKKLKKNKKYKISLKDIILLESLHNDGLSIPKEISYEEVSKNNMPPAELLNLVKNKETGLALLKIVELIGEDELEDLDSQTVYFVNHLLGKAGLIKLRNKILITVLPDRSKI
jgi:hypothetical protein